MALIRGLPKQTGGAVAGNVRVLGVQQAIAKLESVKRFAQLELGFTVTATAAIMETRAKEYVPVITGNLKSSIKTERVGPYDSVVTASSLEGNVEEKNDKEYAGFVEFGTSKMAGRFFMTKAWRESYPYAVGQLQALAARIQSL
jgi:HK97 gp10 family phage protein